MVRSSICNDSISMSAIRCLPTMSPPRVYGFYVSHKLPSHMSPPRPYCTKNPHCEYTTGSTTRRALIQNDILHSPHRLLGRQFPISECNKMRDGRRTKDLSHRDIDSELCTVSAPYHEKTSRGPTYLYRTNTGTTPH